MVSLRIGVECQSILTGKVYRVKMVNQQMVVVESADGSSQVLTHRENFHLFYKTVFQTEDEQSNLGGDSPSFHWRRPQKIT